MKCLKIKSIVPSSIDVTWDIWNYDERAKEGNFFIDGVLVHNSVPTYMQRRNGEDVTWRDEMHPSVLEVLGDTFGVILTQEQLTSLWTNVGGFTNVESQNARKAVAKKRKDQLEFIRNRWIEGSSPIIGYSTAVHMADLMESFGRYAFNKSHAIAYCLLAYRCLWFKVYFPEEWWAAVLGNCNQIKLIKYISAARSEKINLTPININKLTIKPVAHSGHDVVKKGVSLGLINIKGVGESLASNFADDAIECNNKSPDGGYSSLDHFIEIKGHQKTLMERLIKLGSFTEVHNNIRATWMWYLHNYQMGQADIDGEKVTVASIKKKHKIDLLNLEGWTEDRINSEKERQAAEFKKLYPKRKVPNKILNWVPKPVETYETISKLYPNDYTLRELLEFEKKYLGYYWNSPCDLYQVNSANNIENAKISGRLEGVITNIIEGVTKTGKKMMKLFLSDGQSECLIFIWENDIDLQDRRLLHSDSGIRMRVIYDDDRKTFTLSRGCLIEKLMTHEYWQEQAQLVE